ncbi:respiratory nitrate reductase subunit gamma [Agrilactobacillus fermenti]|uniref:respiratory nitrate reductase subunit gamma n=1 Tax=Agrilactobacillus fermenti TaxID=2586909 RepID=UPI001E4194C8|nr:respiratory nitrate reductase subunit gamma [Agrilactobacillus fermenti]MCD2255670.1 respiratory nitrate reductase subunit gamma [Agrilactobacillus fermenti]
MAHPVDWFFWTVYPYLMLLSFFFGTIIRFAFYPASVTAKSSELLEKKKLMVGSILFHIGIILVFFGHVVGILVPKLWTDALGIPDHIYHLFALGGGGVGGGLALIGMLILTYRRFSDARVHLASSTSDLIVNVALLVTIILGLAASFIAGPSHPAFNYRETLSVWARQLFYFRPNYLLMVSTPMLYKIHVVCGLAIFGFFPYTRLVHALALPWQYIYRRYLVYRRKPQV